MLLFIDGRSYRTVRAYFVDFVFVIIHFVHSFAYVPRKIITIWKYKFCAYIYYSIFIVVVSFYHSVIQIRSVCEWCLFVLLLLEHQINFFTPPFLVQLIKEKTTTATMIYCYCKPLPPLPLCQCLAVTIGQYRYRFACWNKRKKNCE